MRNHFLSLSAFLLPTLAMASAPAQLKSHEATVEPYSQALGGWRLYGGAGAGYATVRSNEYTATPDGPQASFSALGSFIAPSWVLDLGASWYYSRLNGKEILGRHITISTHAASIDLSPRLRISEHWQWGPVLNVAFGTDTQYGPSVGQELGTYFVGERLVHERMIDRFPVRFWQQASTDVSIAGRQSFSALVGVQVGFPVKGPRYEPGGVLAAGEERAFAISGVAKRGPEVRIVLDPQKIFFGTNKALLRPAVRQALREVGQYLASRPESWQSVEVDGHADRRGTLAYNQRLSTARAQAVAATLIGTDGASSASRERIASRGFSFLKPLDPRNTPAGWAHNRRVEIVFSGVTDVPALKRQLTPLMESANEVYP